MIPFYITYQHISLFNDKVLKLRFFMRKFRIFKMPIDILKKIL